MRSLSFHDLFSGPSQTRTPALAPVHIEPTEARPLDLSAPWSIERAERQAYAHKSSIHFILGANINHNTCSDIYAKPNNSVQESSMQRKCIGCSSKDEINHTCKVLPNKCDGLRTSSYSVNREEVRVRDAFDEPMRAPTKRRLVEDDHITYAPAPLVPIRSPHKHNFVDNRQTSFISPPPIPLVPSGEAVLRPARKKRKARICKETGCDKYVVDHGLCIRHGGGKRCNVEGCDCRAQNRGLCWKHGGYTICKIDGCAKRAKSRGICWTHGGGTRCKIDGCAKIAVSQGRCWAHGGGKRCAMDGCKKPASERTDNYCTDHFAWSQRASFINQPHVSR